MHIRNKRHFQEELCRNMLRKRAVNASHLHSLLRRLIWSVTKLCSRKDTSGLLMASSPKSLEEASSMTQWTKARVKRSSLRASVWGCCEKNKYCQNWQTSSAVTSKQPHYSICLYLHQCVFRELWRVKDQSAVWRGVHGFSLTVSTASFLARATVQEPGWVNVAGWACSEDKDRYSWNMSNEESVQSYNVLFYYYFN